MNLASIALLIAAGMLPSVASAVNKCTGVDGQVVYSDAPCKNTHKSTKMEWEPRADTNMMNGGDVGVLSGLDLSGPPEIKVSKAIGALENMSADGLDCKIRLQIASTLNRETLDRCEPFFQQMSIWWRPLIDTLGAVLKGPEAEKLKGRVQDALRIADRVAEYSRFANLRMQSLRNR